MSWQIWVQSSVVNFLLGCKNLTRKWPSVWMSVVNSSADIHTSASSWLSLNEIEIANIKREREKSKQKKKHNIERQEKFLYFLR